MASVPDKNENRKLTLLEMIVLAAAVVIVLAGIQAARAIIIPFLLALFIGIIISAVLDWLRRRDIHTGLAIFLLIFLLVISSLIGISVVVTSVNELVARLPELSTVVQKQEKDLIHWLEERGITTSLPQFPEESSSQSLEISVPGLVPMPEGSSLPVTTESKIPEASSSSVPPEATTSVSVSEPVGSGELEGEAVSSEALPVTEVMEEPQVTPDSSVELSPPWPANPFGFPGYIFGQQKHVIELQTIRNGTSQPPAKEGVLGVFTPIQLIRAFLESVVSLINYTLIVMLMLLFLLLEWSRFGKKLEAVPGDSQRMIDQVTEILASVRRYMLIKTLVSLLTGVLITIALLLLDTDYAALWGIFAFLFNYIPTIGSMIAGVVPVLYVLVDQGPWAATYVALVFLVVNFLIGNLLEPRIMGEG
ncbi:MAG: AI-2E family transporter, partial [Planctomycetaceae bacterium]|nr:AI-2E family transporter [Planctomycetaceae bacterium]